MSHHYPAVASAVRCITLVPIRFTARLICLLVGLLTTLTTYGQTLTVSNGLSCSALSATLTASSSCTGNVTYRFSGPNDFMLVNTTGLASVSVNGAYSVTATSADGLCTTTASATVQTKFSTIISQPPSSSVICTRGIVTLSTSTTGGQSLSYQWFRNDVALTNTASFSGVMSATLTMVDVQTASAGQYYAIISSSCNSLTTNVFSLTVNPPTHPSYGPMADFFYSTNGMNWTNRTGWLTNCDPCNGWHGVLCGWFTKNASADKNSSALTLIHPTHPQSGPLLSTINIPPPVFIPPSEKLNEGSYPTHISLYNNQLQGFIPDSFTQLDKLIEVNFNLNNLTGPIPANIGQISNLHMFWVEINQLTGTFPESLTRLSKLTDLRLTGNKLTGPIPAQIDQMLSLRVLALNANQLNGDLPTSFTNCLNLHYLNLSNNAIGGSIPYGLSRLGNLEVIDIQNNRLTGSMPCDIAFMPKLSLFWVNDNNLSGCIPASFTALCSKWVRIERNYSLSGSNDWGAFCNNGSGACAEASFTITATNSAAMTAVRGGIARLGVQVQGGAVTYQWFHNGVALQDNHLFSGSQSPNLRVSNLQAGNAGGYYAVVTSSCKSLTSQSTSLSVVESEHPDYPLLYNLFYSTNGLNWSNSSGWFLSVNPCVGWYGISCTNNRVSAMNLTNNSLVGCLPASLSALCNKSVSLSGNVGLHNNGDWQAFCQTRAGSCGSCSISITNQPASSSIICRRGIVSVHVSATAPQSLYYQWYKDNIPLTNSATLSGAHSPTLTIMDAQLTDAATYSVVVGSVCGHVASTSFRLTVQQPAHPDYLALADLFYTTQGKDWTNRANWLTNCDPCNGWFGLTCQEARVIFMVMPNNHIVGSIPVSIGTLTRLTDIVLNANQLKGELPAELGKLTDLRQIYFPSNSFTGPLPVSMSACTAMQSIRLNNNQLTGTIPASYSALTQLRYLGFDTNRLTGPIPESFSTLTGLDMLQLDDNQLTGGIPTSFRSLTNLRVLGLSLNQLTGSIPTAMSAMVGLQYLFLNNNKLSGHIPEELSKLKLLKHIHLGYNELVGYIPSTLAALQNLEWLTMSNNRLIGTIPLSFRNSPKLAYLYASFNQLSGCLPSSLTALCDKQVDISNNPGLPNNGDWAGFCANGAGSYNGTLTTTKTGYWHDKTVWSCGAVPQPGDRAVVQHPVTVAPVQLNQAGQVRLEGAGKLIYETGGLLKMGN